MIVCHEVENGNARVFDTDELCVVGYVLSNQAGDYHIPSHSRHLSLRTLFMLLYLIVSSVMLTCRYDCFSFNISTNKSCLYGQT